MKPVLTLQEVKETRTIGKMWGLHYDSWVPVIVHHTKMYSGADHSFLYFAPDKQYPYHINNCSLFVPVKYWKGTKPKYTSNELVEFGADKFWFDDLK